jgi:hypothetical protein
MEADKLSLKTTYAGEITISWQEVISKGIFVIFFDTKRKKKCNIEQILFQDFFWFFALFSG